MTPTNTPKTELRFNKGDTLGGLALRVKEAYDRGDIPILIACQDFTFPDNVVLGGLWDSPMGPIQWNQIIQRAFQEVGGLPQGRLRAVPNPEHQPTQPYSMCLEYSPEY